MLKHLTIDPVKLKANPWNTNVVSAENLKKLENSIKREGFTRSILVRELTDGSFEIIGGKHRIDVAIKLGIKSVVIESLGVISDTKAKEISLIDNERYGENDDKKLERLLNSLESTSELHSFMPIDADEYDYLFIGGEDFTLDNFDIDDGEDEIIEKPIIQSPTHRMLRFKVATEDAEKLSAFIDETIKDNKFNSSDALTNAGDALIHIIKEVW